MKKRVTSATLVLLAGACSVAHPTPGDDVHAQLAEVEKLVAKDAQLSAFLRPNVDGFLPDAAGVVSPGWRSAKLQRYSDLGASLPAFSDGEMLVGISQFARLRVSFRHEGARAAPLTLDAGRALYAGVYPSTDLVVAAKADAVEELFVLKDADSPTRFTYRVALPSGLPRARLTEDGTLAFENVAGETQLSVARPYAIDAVGQKRDCDLSWDGTTMGIRLDTTGLTYPIVLDPSFVTWSWRKVESPSERSTHVLAYDAARKETVLFGGVGLDATSLDETWVLSRDFWSKRNPVLSPRPRTFSGMVYDAKRGETVLFGGTSGALALQDTWAWDGVNWNQRTTVKAPAGRQGPSMAYDAKRERIVLFGGFDLSSLRGLGDTWLWDGASWTMATPPMSPPARSSASAAYDEARGRVVLFGGISTTILRDTWIWDGTTWSEAHPRNLPPACGNASMAYDSSLKRIVLALGEQPSVAGPPTPVGKYVFSWDGANWTDEAPFPGDPRARAPMAGASDGGVVLQGGQVGAGQQIFAETWRFTGGQWHLRPTGAPALRANASLAAFPPMSQVVMVGGRPAVDPATLADSWVWTGGWAPVSGAPTPARRRSAMAYDSVRSRLVLFGGGTSTDGYLNDTWEWDGVKWLGISSAMLPQSRTSPALGFFGDPTRPRTILNGGNVAAGGVDLDSTWDWDGSSWTKLMPAHVPPARSAHAMAYDKVRNRLIMFGGSTSLTALANFGDTWLWDGLDWTKAEPLTAPAARSGHQMAYDPATDRVLLFGGKTYDGTTQNDLWAWDGITWTLLSTAGSPPARYHHTMAYDPTRFGLVLFGGLTGAADSTFYGDTWFASTRGGACTRAADCPGANCVDGVCCESDKCGTCAACNLSTPGQCSPIYNAQDLDSCSGTSSCDSLGHCGPGPGALCASAHECGSGFCVDGVCCDSACNGDCVACRADMKEFGANGQCGPAKASTDPRDSCPDDGTAACQRDGQCDGKGKCRLYPPSSCGCDGDHTVTSPQAKPTDCSPFRCEGSRCKTTCGSIRDCAPPYQCSRDGLCIPPADALDAPEGCTCRMHASSGGPAPWALGAVGFIALLVRRRRNAHVSS